MKEEFKKYLIERGYSIETPTGNPSTVYDYVKRIDRVCEWEHINSWQELSNSLPIILLEYDIGGIKENYGKKSHNAVINALKRFAEFCSKRNIL